MIEGEKIELFSWFRIYFIENEGMAYGITLGSKLFLTLFRIVAMTVGSFYLARMVKRGTYPVGFLVCLAMIIAGGFGNVIDCIFYGKIFSSSIGQVAQFVPWGSGYGELLHGKVVDMISVPLVETTYPNCLSGQVSLSYSLVQFLTSLMRVFLWECFYCLFVILVCFLKH